jgi:hypothetical protein
MASDTSEVGRELVPARLQVRLLGAVEIILDGRRLRAFNSLRLLRFLALIALRRPAAPFTTRVRALAPLRRASPIRERELEDPRSMACVATII